MMIRVTDSIDFEGDTYSVSRLEQTGAYIVEPVGSASILKATLLEMALDKSNPEVTEAAVEALAIEAMPYAPRLWKKLPAPVREQYRTLARRALAATRSVRAARHERGSLHG